MARNRSCAPPHAPRTTAASTPRPSAASSNGKTLCPKTRPRSCRSMSRHALWPCSVRSIPAPLTATATSTLKVSQLPAKNRVTMLPWNKSHPLIQSNMTRRNPMTRKPRHPATDPDDEELDRLAVDLDLTTLPRALPELLSRAEREGLSYTDFTLALLRSEWNVRQERKVARSLKRSRLGPVDGLDSFDFAARPHL